MFNILSLGINLSPRFETTSTYFRTTIAVCNFRNLRNCDTRKNRRNHGTNKCRATLLHPIERTYRWQQLAIGHREKVRSAEWWVSEHDSEQTFAGEQQSCGISIAITRT